MTYKVGVMQIALQPKKHQEDFLETAYGAFRSLQFGDRFCNLLSLTGYATGFFKESAAAFNKGWTILAVPRLPGAFGSLQSEVQNFSKASEIPGSSCRKYVRLAMEVATFTSIVCYSAIPFVAAAQKTAQIASLLRLGSLTSSFSDLCDFQINATDGLLADNLAIQAKNTDAAPELQVALNETKTMHMLKTAKATAAILGTGLGIVGMAAFPGATTTAAVISLATTTLAIAGSLYEKGMHQEKVKFFDDKHIQQLTPAVG